MGAPSRPRKQSWVSRRRRRRRCPARCAALAAQPCCRAVLLRFPPHAARLLLLLCRPAHLLTLLPLPSRPPARLLSSPQFQTEIAEKIPLSVQQACANDWRSQQAMAVVCAELGGTFYVNSAGEYLIRLGPSGEVVTPNKFEELAGKKTARNWQQSIRLVGAPRGGRRGCVGACASAARAECACSPAAAAAAAVAETLPCAPCCRPLRRAQATR